MGRPTRLWVTRARPFSERTIQHLDAFGYDVIAAPLFDVRPLDCVESDQQPDLIAFTSLNGVLHHPYRPEWGDVPVFAGGDATALQARKCGYRDVRSAGGGVTDLQELVLRSGAPVGARVIHFSAKEPAGNLTTYLRSRGYNAERHVVYETVPTILPQPQALLFGRRPIDGIVVHSPKSAKRVARLISHTGWRGLVFCLSRSCAEAFRGIRGLSIEWAPEPTEASLVAVVRDALAARHDDLVALRLRGLKVLGEINRSERTSSANDNFTSGLTPA